MIGQVIHRHHRADQLIVVVPDRAGAQCQHSPGTGGELHRDLLVAHRLAQPQRTSQRPLLRTVRPPVTGEPAVAFCHAVALRQALPDLLRVPVGEKDPLGPGLGDRHAKAQILDRQREPVAHLPQQRRIGRLIHPTHLAQSAD